MAGDFQTRIEDIIGSVGDTQLITNSLTDAASEFINMVPAELLWSVSTETADKTTNGYSVSNVKILDVRKENGTDGEYVSCKEVPLNYERKVQDPNSLFYPSSQEPIFFRKAGGIYVYGGTAVGSSPNAFKVVEISYPAVAFGDSSVAAFPDEWEYIIVLGAAIKCRMRQLADKRGSLPSTLDLSSTITLPSVPSVPVFSYSDASATNISAQTVSISGTAPTYTKPVFSAPSLTSIGTMTLPEVPVASPTTAQILTITGTAPTYTSPTTTISGVLWATEYPSQASAVTAALALVKAELDETQSLVDDMHNKIGLASTQVGLAVAEAAEIAIQTDNSGDFGTALDAITTAVDKFRAGDDPGLFGNEDTYHTTDSKLIQVRDALDLARDAIDTGFTTDEDSGSGDDATPKSVGYWLNDEDTEMAQATLATAQTEISRAQAHISEWSATVQALQAEINGFATEVQSRASFTGAKGQAVQAIVSEASAYLNAAQGYSGELQSKIGIAQGYSSEIQSRLSLVPPKVSEYQVRMTDALNTFNDANIEYQAKLNKDVQDVTMSDREEGRKLQKYQQDVSKYQAEVNKEVQRFINEEFNVKIQEWQTEYSQRIASYNADMQNELNEFNKENIEYQAKLQSDILDAQNAQRAAESDAQLETDVDKQNKLQDLQKQIQEYTISLQRYSSEVQSYSAAINGEVQEYANNIQRYTSEHSLMAQELQALQAQYNQSIQILIGEKK